MNAGISARTVLMGLAMGFAVLFAGSRPLTAQEGGEGPSAPAMEHAEIGTLEAMGLHNDRIVVALPTEDPTAEPIYRTFVTDFDTDVDGLGAVMRVGEIPQAATDNVVVVSFVRGEERPRATRLYFPDEQTVRIAHGTIESIDGEGETFVLTTPEGRQERYDVGVGPGAPIDSNEGLLSFSDLRVGQEVTVYHAETPGTPGAAQETLVVFRHPQG